MAKIVLYGATGYTGQLTANALLENGNKPLLAGRNAGKLKELAASLGDLEYAVVDPSDVDSLARVLNKGDVLVATVGPFVRYGRYALNAALRAGAHYIDSTGEPVFISDVFLNASKEAESKGCALLSAMGYDYAPGHCAAALALEKAGARATRVDIGYFMKETGIPSLSQGTFVSLAEAVVRGSHTYKGGRIQKEGLGRHVRRFFDGERKRWAMSVPGSEAFSLYRIYPELKEINGFNGWFGPLSIVFSAYLRLTALLLKLPLYGRFLEFLTGKLSSSGKGADTSSRSYIVACAHDANGKEVARASLEGINGYLYTGKMLAWAAQAIADGKLKKSGALGPIEAFGLGEFVEGNRLCGLNPDV
ncbi:MAG: saccharopine dehydrogenase NADP-binding domain-containing protein [Chrysiogenetes bacterium]|nr:saccharopine dehydrogenase NADP-binding domain-containing protein [Chrysiogenetes bacterium]